MPNVGKNEKQNNINIIKQKRNMKLSIAGSDERFQKWLNPFSRHSFLRKKNQHYYFSHLSRRYLSVKMIYINFR